MDTFQLTMIILVSLLFAISVISLIVASLAYTRNEFSSLQHSELVTLASESSQLSAIAAAVNIESDGDEQIVVADGFADGFGSDAQRFITENGQVTLTALSGDVCQLNASQMTFNGAPVPKILGVNQGNASLSTTSETNLTPTLLTTFGSGLEIPLTELQVGTVFVIYASGYATPNAGGSSFTVRIKHDNGDIDPANWDPFGAWIATSPSVASEMSWSFMGTIKVIALTSDTIQCIAATGQLGVGGNSVFSSFVPNSTPNPAVTTSTLSLRITGEIADVGSFTTNYFMATQYA